MKALVFDRFGEPGDVLQVRDVPIPEPGPGQVRVRMISSPVNPSDLLVVKGRYGVLPKLPATPGFEGGGVVETSLERFCPGVPKGGRHQPNVVNLFRVQRGERGIDRPA